MKKSYVCLPVILTLVLLFSCNQKKVPQPLELRCEFQENPLGIDVTAPRFSWQLGDSSRGSVQTAYQVVVATNLKRLSPDEADIWNSGRIESDQSHLVVYNGPALESGTRYYWAVRTWNENDRPSAFSSPAWWETGILEDAEWKAKWIGNGVSIPEPLNHGKWIWSKTSIVVNKPVYFRKKFQVDDPQRIHQAILNITAYKQFNAHLNNKYIGRGGSAGKMYSHNLTPFLHEGENVLAINAMTDKNEAGLVFSIQLIDDNGDTTKIISDESCKNTRQQFEHWKTKQYDDLTWGESKIVATFAEAKWANDMKFTEPPASIAVRKVVSLGKNIKSARAYVSGLGNYVFYINGKRVGNDILTPGWTHYPEKVQYQTYDVTSMVKSGNNAFAGLLGNMWWSSGLGWDGASIYSNGPLRFLAQIRVTYQNGDTETIITDESWKFNYTPIIYNHIYHGETYDARMEEDGWNDADFNDENWKNVTIINENSKLVAQQMPTIQVTEILEAVNITEAQPGIYVLDFGQNMVGRARLKVTGEKGQRIVMRFAELLHEDGTVAQENLRMAKATDTYILSGEGTEEWVPEFTYHGFRYIQVEGLKETPDKSALTGEVFHTNVPFNGSFTCSNSLLNKIWKNITWGQRGNLMSVPTDCPQRDERLGWMGDAQIFAPTANYNMYMPSFWSKWEKDIIDCQEPEGWVYDVNPAIVVSGPSKPGWGDAAVIVPWHNYVFFGDTRILEANYEGMKAWVDYMEKESENYIYEWGDTDWGGYGDWVAVVPSPTKPIGGIYFNYSSQLLAKMARVLGKTDDAEYYENLAGNIAKAYNDKYLDKNNINYEGETQTANLLPLMTGIAGDDIREQIIENVKNNVVEQDTHLTTGFLGTPYLLPVLSDNGYHDLAYAVATQTTYPSWGYMVENGATSMWELWNSNTEPPEGMNSRNHFAYGSVGEWYFAYLAGIRPDEKSPGFKRSIIAPMPVGDLTWAIGKVQTPYGMIFSEWSKENEKLNLRVTIPPNTRAEIHIPFDTGQKITEDYNILLGNQSGASTEDITFIAVENNVAVYEVPSGRYEFLVSD